MKYSEIEGLKVSKMIFGTATPKLFAAVADAAGKKEEEEAFSLLDDVYECGINTFDCAAHYGEEILGKWMQSRGIREKCNVLTKCAHPNKWRDRLTEYDILSDIHDSLKKLHTDCIDFYLLHRDNKSVPAGKVVEIMNLLLNEGKIKVYGASNWIHERIEEANEYAYQHNLEPMCVSSPNFGIAEQVADPWRCDAKFGEGCVTISGPDHADARTWYSRHSVAVFAYSSLARGFFSGAFKSYERDKAKEILDGPGLTGYYCENNFERLRRCELLAESRGISVAQTAMAWIYHQSFEVFAISSPVTKEQIRQNIQAMEISLSEREVKWLNLEADAL